MKDGSNLVIALALVIACNYNYEQNDLIWIEKEMYQGGMQPSIYIVPNVVATALIARTRPQLRGMP